MIKVDLSGAAGFFDPAGPDYAAAAQAHRTLLEQTGAGKDFTGWLDLPGHMQNGELKQILTAASRIRGRSQALVVVGIGGSYLGAKGALELLRPRPQPGDPKILFAGNSLSPDALMHLLEELGDLDFDLNVVSKSGTTLEPALGFRVFRDLLVKKYGEEEANSRIFATTDARRGALKSEADAAGWESFVVPDDVGGRYSVLSAVGLLPMAAAGIDIIQLAAKEGLALINGTQIMTAIACQAVYDARDLAKTADIAAAMTCQALHGIRKAFDPKVHALRGQPGQITAAENLRRLLEGSGLSFDLNPDKVQDAYAIPCTPQIHGASRDAIGYVWGVVSREINAVTDNPLIFPEEDEAISGGNFHGQPVALAMDFLGIALAEYANVSERRLERLVNPALSEGLPAFLTRHGGVHSGFMIAQYAAASMVSESKIYAHPASVDSIPSSANQEDHVSMGTTAARKALMILDNSQKVLGIELFAGAQALWLRDEDKLSPAPRAVYDRIRTVIPPIEEDVVMHPLMVQADKLVKAHAISQAAEAVCGELQ